VVAKFRATSRLCLAGRSQKDLDPPGACRGCELKSCRSNPEPGAARSYWRTAPVALLTHGAYRAHHMFRPALNQFDGLVCDEVPDFVYRTPKVGTSRWREARDGRGLLALYKEQLQKLGYRCMDTDLTIRNRPRNQRLYVLILASKHPRGDEFWKKATHRDATGQGSLFGPT